MKVVFAALIFACATATAQGATCKALGKPPKYGNQLLATFTKSPGICTTTTTTTAAAGATTKAPTTTTAATAATTTTAKATTTTATAKATTAKATTTNTTVTTTTTTTTTTRTTTVTTTNTTTTTTTSTTTNTTTTTATSTNTTTTTATTVTTTTNTTTTTTTATTVTTTTNTTVTAGTTITTTTNTTKTTTSAPTTATTTTKAATTTTTKAATTTTTTAKAGTTMKAGCVTVPCVQAPAVPLSDKPCNAIAAGKTQECKVVTNTELQKCFGNKVSYSCPDNNADPKRVPDFVTHYGIFCKPCSASLTIKDLDPQAGKYWVALEWGPLMSSKGEFVEDAVTGYEVWMVDSMARKIGSKAVGFAEKVIAAKKCCTKDMYSFSVAGTLPEGAYNNKFMIVPVVGGTSFPMGALTAPFVDVTTGLAAKITGSFTIKVSNAKLFATDKKIEAALREAVADTLEGISQGNVRIISVTVVPKATTRRLDEEDEERRLVKHTGGAAAGTVKVDFEIIVPETYTGKAIKTASIVPAKLMKAINTRVEAKGIVGAKVTSAPVIAVITSKSVGTPKSTGGAERSAQMGLFAALVGFAAIMLN